MPVPTAAKARGQEGLCELLSIHARQRTGCRVGASKRVDIEPAAAVIERLDMQRPGGDPPLEITEHSLDTLLVKLLVLAVGDDVAQQGAMIQRPALIMNPYAGPIGLARDRAQGPQQVGMKLPLN